MNILLKTAHTELADVSAVANRYVGQFPKEAERAPTFVVSVVRSAAGFEQLAPAWEDLEQSAPGALLFQSAGWTRAIMAFEASRGNSGFDPVIVAMRRAGKLIAVLPLELIRLGLRRTLVPMGAGFSQYSDVVMDPQADARAVVQDLLQAAILASKCDVVLLWRVPDGAPLRPGLGDACIKLGEPQGAASLTLTPWQSFDEYFKATKSKTRKNLRNAQNRLEREGTLAYEVAATRETRVALVDRAIAGRAARLKSQGLTSRAFADGGFPHFCRLLAEGLPGFPEVVASSLLHNGRPIAEQWGMVHRGRFYGYVLNRDFSLAEGSPGKLLLREVFQMCFDRGYRAIDLLAPASTYKMTMANEVTPLQDYAVPVTAFGHFSVRFYEGWLRPLAKTVILRLPVGLRSLLTRRAARI